MASNTNTLIKFTDSDVDDAHYDVDTDTCYWLMLKTSSVNFEIHIDKSQIDPQDVVQRIRRNERVHFDLEDCNIRYDPQHEQFKYKICSLSEYALISKVKCDVSRQQMIDAFSLL